MSDNGFVPPDVEIKRLLTEAKTIAVVGLSDNPSRESHSVASYLRKHGYVIVPINPKLEELFGQKAYPDLQSAVADGVTIDLVDVFRRPEHLPEIVQDAIAAKVPAIWFQLGVVDAAAARTAEDSGMRVVMDRCTRVEHGRLVA